MQSSLKPKPTDDPHDCVVIPSDAVRVAPSDAAPSDQEISDLLRAAARQHSDVKSDVEPAAAAEAAPRVDATFRPTAVNDDFAPRRSKEMRAIATLLIAACLGAAAMAWQASGYAAKKLVAKWIPQFALTTSLPLDKLGLTATPAASPGEPAAAEVPAAPGAADGPAQAQAAAEPATPAQAAPESAVAKSESSEAASLQSMARDLAGVSREVEALKASIAELKASQQQMSRDLAKASEQVAHAKMAPARAAVANPRKPPGVYSPPTASAPAYRPSYSGTQAAVAPALPPPPQPNAPRQVEPMVQPQAEPVPRPPLPVQ